MTAITCLIAVKEVLSLILQHTGKIALSTNIVATVGPDIRLDRISGWILKIEIIRPYIQYCQISDNLVFSIKQNLYYPAGYPAQP